MRKIMLIALVLITVLSSVGIASAAPITWVTQSVFSLQLPLGQAYLSWAKKVEEMSGGRLLIETHSDGEIVPPASTYESVRDGVLDAAMNTPAWQKGLFPAGDLFYTLPGGVTGTLDLVTWAYTDGLKLQQEMYGDTVVVFPLGLTPAEVFWSSKEVRTLDDLKGLKMRASGLGMELLTKLGVSVVQLPGGEVVPALRRGVIDSAEFCFPSMDEGLGIHEVAKYMITPPIHMGSNMFQLFINPKKWNELPDDLKAIVKNAAHAATLEVYASQMREQAGAMERLQAAGVTFIKLSPEDQKKVREMSIEILEEKSKTNEWFAKIWNSQKSLIKDLGNFISLTNWDN
ncbi:TRAP transporter substrate-binding protein [Aminivibrio sp.]|uniref:TRAP transporter substrate-binding protein n=1 Tax=Aminivibrio sp. TaxID=1872489 RepID=UPI00345EBA94